MYILNFNYVRTQFLLCTNRIFTLYLSGINLMLSVFSDGRKHLIM